MGLLNELFLARLALHDKNNKSARTNIKKEIVKKNIYGVDIEKGAVDIARLRFWLAIIVDEDKPTPLPNLDYKIMQGNSLLETYAGVELFDKEVFMPANDPTQLFSPEMTLQTIQRNINARIDSFYYLSDHERKLETKAVINSYIKDLIVSKKQLQAGKNEEMIREELKELNLDNNIHFFLWHTWFKEVFENGGFDIVIGNPPYIQLQNDEGKLAKLYEKEKFDVFAKTGDIYCLFYEKGLRLLKDNGILCYITSNKWMRAGYGEKLRGYISANSDPKVLVDFTSVKIFESATVDTNILLLEKTTNSNKTKACDANEITIDGLKNLSNFVEQNSIQCSFNTSESWVILNSIEQSIRDKMNAVGTPLKDWGLSINRGILTGYNEAFIISAEKRDEILSNCISEEERQRTAELIRPNSIVCF